MPKGKKVIISGFYGYRNTGDEAILAAIINSLKKEIKNIDITVFSKDPVHTFKVHNTRAVYQLQSAIKRGKILKFFQSLMELWKSDVLIFGGGGFLSDWQSWIVIPQWLSQAVLAKILGKKVMLYAIGAGSLTTQLGKFWTRTLIDNFVDVVTVRDNESRNWLRNAGVRKKIVVTADPALLLESVTPHQAQALFKKEKIHFNKPAIGVSISPVFHLQKFWPNEQNRLQKFREAWLRVIEFVTKKLNVRVILIPMSPEDREFNLDLIKGLENKDVKIVMGNYASQEIAGMIGQTDLLIGLPLHSMILASLNATPIVGVVYHHKCCSFLERINQQKFAVDVGDSKLWKDSDIDVNKLLHNIKQAWANKNSIKKEISSKVRGLQSIAKLNTTLAKNLLFSS